MPTTSNACDTNPFPRLSPADLERLVRSHGRRLRNFIRRRVGNIADVEDIVQDTCLEALRCLSGYHGRSRPETWLFGIAVNLVRGHYRKCRMQPLFEGEDDSCGTQSDMAEDPCQTIERHEEVNRMLEVVGRMPKSFVSVLGLVFDEHLTYEQTASRLQIPVGTVRSRIARARVLLRGHTTGCKERKPS